MFYDLIEFPIRSKKLSWESRQVVRDIEKKPHLFQRFTLKGTIFQERALKPFIRVGEQVAFLTEIAPDGRSVNGYFEHPVAPGHTIEFGYGNKVFLLLPEKTNRKKYQLLDLHRIPEHTKNAEYFTS